MDEIDKLLEKRTDFEHMLEFETQIFMDIVHNDALVVAAKGLNLDLAIINLMKVYCDEGNLVLVLNSYEHEEKYFIETLKDGNVHSTTYTTSTTDRESLYLTGGIHFVTTRILVVDMLKKRIPIEKITGFIILRAHKIVESCQEAFVLRLFRQNNRTGFIKAFSNNVQSFTMGFGHVERVMRAIFVKELYIWPRFHSTVIQSFKQHEPQVIELHIPISECLNKIQTLILELMNLTVKELKRTNKTIELNEITVENCLTKQFQKILQLQLDMIWNQLSPRSRQLIADLKTLRHLIISMLHLDPISFYCLLSTYRSMEYAKTANWIFLDPADLLFTEAKRLVFSGDRELNPEFCPKWKSLLEILKVEIPEMIKKANTQENKILILCGDNKTCFQLNEILYRSPQHFLFLIALEKGLKFKSINKDFSDCRKLPDVSHNARKNQNKKIKLDVKHELAGKSSDNEEEEEDTESYMKYIKNSYILTMSQTTEETAEDGSKCIFEPFEEMENLDLTQICKHATAPTILIQTFKGLNDLNLQRSLEIIEPSFIIMYESNVTAIREIEMYEAHRQNNKQLKVFFLIHAGTVEEQSYLTTLRREKEAFEFLIETKSTMVVPEDQDGKTDICGILQRDLRSPTKNTRQGGKEDEPLPKKIVIVDMREFRSELPALIHKRGMDIEPVTIAIGDYILTPDICVERKSLSDLVGSLNSGRLYQQCTQMSRCYTKPMLLIEFDQNKPFSWQNNYVISSDGDNFNTQQKLLLLTMHFPKLKVIWSPSPYASAQLFEELKEAKEEPNVEYTAAIGEDQDLDIIESKYNSNIYDFIQKLPGITSKNICSFLRKFNNLNQVANATQDEFKDVLGNPIDAKALYSAIHDDHNLKEEPLKDKGKVKTKFKYIKK